MGPAYGATVGPIVVNGSANPYLAGMPPGSTCCAAAGGAPDSAPNQSPVQVGIALSAGTVLTFSATGTVSFDAGPHTDGPDGGVFNTIDTFGLDGTPSSNGIAGMLAPQNALVGLFLDNSVPTSSGAPPRLDFSDAGLGRNFTTLSPGLKQPFFIGNGLTGTGGVQQFVVPAGATRFFLGTVDGVEWSNNTGSFSVTVTSTSPSVSLAAAVLPSSRSVQVGTTATVFATVINAGGSVANGVGISLATGIPATFSYQTTDPATNALTGSPNQPANINPGQFQTFVISITPTAAFGPTDVAFNFAGTNTAAVPTLVGINTLLMVASNTPVPDVIAVAATLNNDGIVNIPGATGTGVFSVATFNLGASGSITVSADTGGTALPVIITVCQTNPGTGVCLAPPGASVTTTINSGATPTFGIFVAGTGTVAFDPAHNRVFLRLNEGSVTRGSTSVAVRTQ
jgi:hypothetical protein